jgi:hypothetical protein
MKLVVIMTGSCPERGRRARSKRAASGRPRSEKPSQIRISRAPEARRAVMLEARGWSPARIASLNPKRAQKSNRPATKESPI